jgi:hypothetical protein
MAANMTDREFYAAHALLVAFHRMPSASREVQVEEAFRLADLMLER